MQRAFRWAAFASAILFGASCSDPMGPETIDAPSGVTVVMVTPTSAKVTWTASPSGDKVRSYNVFRNGAKVGEVTTTSYTDDGLAELTAYRYTVSANGVSGTVSALSADSPSSTITPPDVTPPRVVASTPVAGASGVSSAATITATFSEAVEPATLTTASFVVKSESGAVIPGTIVYTPATRVAEYRPNAALPSGGSVSVTITTAVKDMAGNALASAFAMTFSVRDETPPSVIATSLPASGQVPLTQLITATMSEALDPLSVTSSTVRLTAEGGATVSGSTSYDVATHVITFTPSAALSYSTVYTFVVTTGVRDVAGNPMQSQFSASFTTVAAPPPADTTRPTVLSSVPANGATGVAVNSAITLSFSEAMTGSTITPSSFVVSVQGGGAIAGSAGYDQAGARATFTPSAALQNGVVYTVTASPAMTDLAGNSLVPFSASFTTVNAIDLTPPAVVSVTPGGGSTGVSVNTQATVKFSRAMNSATLTASTITLTPAGGSPVAANIGYDGGSNTATLTPSSALAASTTYTITVTTGVQGSNGVSLPSTFTSSFTTATPSDTTPPAVVSSSPANGASNVAVNSIITVTFSEAMDGGTVGAASMALKVSSNSETVPGTFSFNPATKTVSFTPSGNLAFSTGYTMVVSTGAKDLAGNNLAAPVFISFTTAQGDVTPPAVVSTSPANEATNVSVGTTVTATFSEDVQASTITSGTFKLSAGGTDVAASVAYDQASRTATLTPSAPLANSVTYTVTVTTGVKDLAGNSLAANYVSTFTTVASGGGFNIGGEPHFAGTTATDQIHVHVTLVQTGTTLSLAPTCQTYLCSMIPLNQAGADIVGPNSPGELWANMASVSGSIIGSAVSFTITLDNGRTFNFSGTATSSDAFAGTLSGATQPPVGLAMVRSQ